MLKFLPAALCVLLSVSCLRADEERELAAPRDVHFHSVNLRNTVHWSSGTADTQGTTYTVEYAIYGDAVDVEGSEQVVWRPAQQCADITQTECDVTEQTGDIEEEYYVRVRANGREGHSEWTETDRRLRLADTVLGPPQLNISVVESKLQVKLSGPFRWRSLGKKRQSMFNIFPHMVYNISVYNNSSKRMHFLQAKKLLQHGPLEYNSEYCVRAEVLSMSLHLTSTLSDWICISTADDPFKSQMLLLMLGGILPTAICLFVLVAVGGFAYYYICGHKPRLPKSVTDIQRDAEVERKLQTFQPEKHLPTINVIIINNTNLSTGESKHSFLSSLHHGVDVPERLPLPEVRETMGGDYAAQNVQQTSAAAASCPQSRRSSLSEEYCWVHQEDRNQVAYCPNNSKVVPQCVGGISSYMAQTGITEQAQETYEEEEEIQTTFCNWDLDTSHLQLDFPLLSRFRLETSETTETQKRVTKTQMPRRPDLTSVVVKQASEEAGDDDLLLNLEKHWDLQVQSSTE
ncbi:interleukin-20 receptor subunit alpha isoform X2 [Hemibagrus wyckioides]|uniref:interleukin-20 receptor subunit alpha isoform X2 n=1 Tax=Hemibagrus wyckioides TaxID=337641 RepID=UPI00266C5348|nr:interleukin-20 receptor subunit alpha isoform X2 [Hemibagrus wyckioides]